MYGMMQVGAFHFALSELIGTSCDGFNAPKLIQRIMVHHCTMLMMRLIFDVARLAGWELD